MNLHSSYALFGEFIREFTPLGFENIDRDHPLVNQLEKFTDDHHQFISISDLIGARVLWVSQRCKEMLGVAPEEFNAAHSIDATHPDFVKKHAIGRARMWQTAMELFAEGHGSRLLSANLRIRNERGVYVDRLFQLLFFFCAVPRRTVFVFTVHTDLAEPPIWKKGGHYYVGPDTSLFRAPNATLLAIGNPLTTREVEIALLLDGGMSSEAIARKLDISPHTVSTHRKNMLARTGCDNMTMLLRMLREKGLL